ncbi:MAG TPA: hypothetical protein VK936_14550 [Longimicrobiales bacterium]|nr:hypothetical protein [Longimicrobiales bacterium]
MRRIMSRIAPLAIAGVVAAGCAEPAGPVAVVRDAQVVAALAVDFDLHLVRPGSDAVPEPSARGESGRIVARGAIGTAVPCHDIGASATLQGRTATLEVAVIRRDEACIMVPAVFAFDAVLRDVPAGTYTMRIVYALRDRQPVHYTILEQPVHVR